MRRLALFTALALSACRTAPADSDAAAGATMRILETGSYAAAATAKPGSLREAAVHLATTDAEYRDLWRRHISPEIAPPPADFSRESVVFLLLGQRSSGGWSVEPEAISVRGDEVEVLAPVSRPEPGGVVTMAFSAPFAVVAVERPGLTAATWSEGEGDLVARSGDTVER